MLGLIGCGNMGSALFKGIVYQELVPQNQTMIFDLDIKKSSLLKTAFPETTEAMTSQELTDACEAVIVAIKPQDIPDFLNTHYKILDDKQKIVISIAAGIPVSLYREYLAFARIVRVMPNTPTLIGEGAAALYFDGDYETDEKKLITGFFSSNGMAEEIKKESLLNAVTGLSGSGPAYVFEMIQAMADGGVMQGLPRETATRLAVQTVLGAAKLAGEEYGQTNLSELKDRITSPAGTTARGLYELEKNAFHGIVMSAVKSAAERSEELGEKQ